MPVICPKCSHVRPPDATNPDWQCPACGICYAKFQKPGAEPVRPARATYVQADQGWNLGWLFKAILLVALGWGLNAAIERRSKVAADAEMPVAEERVSEPSAGGGDSAGVALANAALQASGADTGMLKTLSGRLEKACARNKYNLSESACIARLREREDLCATATAQRYPGQIGDTDRMQIVTKAYVGCIFEN
jgi:hypothetical protein